MTGPRIVTPWEAFLRPYNPASEVLYRDSDRSTRADRRNRGEDEGPLINWTLPPLPILPPPVRSPPYLNSPPEDSVNAALYTSCAQGNLIQVQDLLRTNSPLSAASLAFALEEACQNFQLEVVRFLLTETEAELHFRCFRRCIANHEYDLAENIGSQWPPSTAVSQSIFTSGCPKLLPLLQILKEFGSWHPNQVLGPLQRGKQSGYPGRSVFSPRQEVALHYPRCVLDLEILDFLLDAGADASIARYFYSALRSDADVDFAAYPVQRHSGDILQMAANCGATETAITTMIERGHTRLIYGTLLHSLVRRESESQEIMVVDQEYRQMAGRQEMEHSWPVLSTRFDTAAHLVKLGEDLDAEVNVKYLSGLLAVVPVARIKATPLSHAKYMMDWPFVRWLLENGADPGKMSTAAQPPVATYQLFGQMDNVEERFQQIVAQVQPGNTAPKESELEHNMQEVNLGSLEQSDTPRDTNDDYNDT